MPVVKEPRPNTSEPYTPPSPAPVQSGPGGSIDFHREVKFGEEERKAPAQENFYETDDMDQNRAHRSLGLLSMRLDVQAFGSAAWQQSRGNEAELRKPTREGVCVPHLRRAPKSQKRSRRPQISPVI